MKQRIHIAICGVSFLATWLLVWQGHYWPCVATLLGAAVSAWRTGFID